MKRILKIHFSQSGQLTTIMDNFCKELDNVQIDEVIVQPQKDFPFPWNTEAFFHCMPETVMEVPIELQDLSFKYERYDLVVLGYQPWFLSPSMPISALLQDKTFKNVIENTPVVTLIGSRNMWLNSQESIKKHLLEANAKLVGNVALADRSHNLIGVITILHWMLTGQKTRKWGVFPIPGVSEEDINNVALYGKLTNDALEKDGLDRLQSEIIENNGAFVNTSILFIEGKAKKIFYVWAKIIRSKDRPQKRKVWEKAFMYYLLFVLFVVSPILLTFYFVLVWPFTQTKLSKKKRYFQNVAFKEKQF